MASTKTTYHSITHTRRIVFTILGLIVLLSGLFIAMYLMKFGVFSENDARKNSTSTNMTPAGLPIESQNTDDPVSNSVKHQPADGQLDNKNTKIQITSAYVTGENLRVRTLIPSLSSTGSCTVTVSKNDGVYYTDSAGVQALASSSTCKGFSIPLSSLETGTWKVTVTYTNGGASSSATKEVVINA